MSRAVVAAALGAGLALAGCGGGNGDSGTQSAAKPQGTATSGGRTTSERRRPPSTRSQALPGSPETQPGGAGDEQPARVPASFTARAGRVRPRTVHVPPFIAVVVSLRSADGRAYALRFPTATLRVGPRRRTASIRLAGIRVGRAVSGRPIGAGSRVRVVADAEPGP